LDFSSKGLSESAARYGEVQGCGEFKSFGKENSTSARTRFTATAEISCGRVVLILYTCFSGGATAVASTAPGALTAAVYSANKSLVGPDSSFSVAADRFEEKSAQGFARVVISASRADEKSQEDEKLQHGYFTYYLVEALKRNIGSAPLGDVFKSVHESVAKAVRDRYGVAQTPTIKATPEGFNIVLGAPSSVVGNVFPQLPPVYAGLGCQQRESGCR
jgi:uncharacterized caspase-like protein